MSEVPFPIEAFSYLAFSSLVIIFFLWLATVTSLPVCLVSYLFFTLITAIVGLAAIGFLSLVGE